MVISGVCDIFQPSCWVGKYVRMGWKPSNVTTQKATPTHGKLELKNVENGRKMFSCINHFFFRRFRVGLWVVTFDGFNTTINIIFFPAQPKEVCKNGVETDECHN